MNSDQICQTHDIGAGYAVDLSFPVDYLDQESLGDYLIPLRNDYVDFAQSPPGHDWPYTLTATSTTYRSAGSPGTQSVVLWMIQDVNPHPVAWYEAFNYDPGAHASITLDKPGTKALDVVFPAVRRELESVGGQRF